MCMYLYLVHVHATRLCGAVIVLLIWCALWSQRLSEQVYVYVSVSSACTCYTSVWSSYSTEFRVQYKRNSKLSFFPFIDC